MTHHRTSVAFQPTPWLLTLAFTILYLSWGTTYLAIQIGVRDEHLPPALFGGMRVCLAGLLLLLFLAARGQPLGLRRRDLGRIYLGSVLLFVGGNGLLTLSEQTVSSGIASILAATCPLWIALLEMGWPGGERLGLYGWFGLALGMSGVICLLLPELQAPAEALAFNLGPVYVLGSALSWAAGMVFLRHKPVECPHLVSASYQMVLGGGTLVLLGLLSGEVHELPARITSGAVGAFVYLLVVGSLIGFLAFNYLLRHVSAAQVGTHAYVNPVIAVLIGWSVAGEEMTGWILVGIAAVLVGVAFVRRGNRSTGQFPPTDHSYQSHPRVLPEATRLPGREYQPLPLPTAEAAADS